MFGIFGIQRLLMGIRHRQTFKIFVFFSSYFKTKSCQEMLQQSSFEYFSFNQKKTPLETRRFRTLCPVPPIRALLLAYSWLLL